jgi:hypothetical protein
VLVVSRVALALLGGGSAGRRAGLYHGPDDAEVGLGLTRCDAARGVAGVGAVEAEANAADQLLHVLLAEACVRAARAGSPAVEAFLDAADHKVAIEIGRSWMLVEHLSNRHVLSLR